MLRHNMLWSGYCSPMLRKHASVFIGSPGCLGTLICLLRDFFFFLDSVTWIMIVNLHTHPVKHGSKDYSHMFP